MPLYLRTVPEYLKEIHPPTSQAWNCDDIGFNPKWIMAYIGLYLQVFYGETYLKYQTG